MKIYKLITGFLLFLFSASFCPHLSAQQKRDTSLVAQQDTSRRTLISRMKELGKEQAHMKEKKFNAEREERKQNELIEKITKTTYAAQIFLKNGIDTTGINAELESIVYLQSIAADGVFKNQGMAQTNRNLANSEQIIHESLSKANEIKHRVDLYENSLVGFISAIDSLSSDSALYQFSEDSAALGQYLKKLFAVTDAIKPTESVLEQTFDNLQVLQLRINLIVNTLHSSEQQIEEFEKTLSSKTFDREFPNLLDAELLPRRFKDILHYSRVKGQLTLWFYVQNNLFRILILLCLTALSYLFIKTLLGKIEHEHAGEDNVETSTLFKYPLSSAILIIFSTFQFMFPSPPFIFNCLLWITSAIALTVLFHKIVSKIWMRAWIAMLVLFLIACLDNLILQASNVERWGLFFLSLAGIILSIYIIVKNRSTELHEPGIIYFIVFVGIADLVALFCNVYGRFNFGKTLLTNSYICLVIANMFLWTIRLVNEGLMLASQVYKKPDKQLFYINFDRVGSKAPSIFYAFMVVGWLLLFGRNFFIFKLILEPIKNFLFTQRTIGAYSFSIDNLFVFFIIMGVAVFVSRLVSFFAADTHASHLTPVAAKKAGVGSWLLLIRIAIFSIGMFLAFAAAGIPIDRITIILGALSVGVGLGLQGLVSNLVSGLIIAFEKPFNVGDVVEVSNHAGTIKSIGFRSSVIANWEGGEVIIPNGDLLNAHVINWTMSNSLRRTTIYVGVAYGTTLDNVKEVILQLIKKDMRILEYPAPGVLFTEFNTSSITVRINFWIQNTADMFPAKSDLIAAISKSFKLNGITIPFPQQDLHIKSIEHNLPGADMVQP